MTELTTMNQESYPDFQDFEILSLKEKLRLSEFENKQKLIEMQCQVELYRNRADDYRKRYEEMLSGSADEQMTELLKKLKERENQIIQIRAKEIQSKSRLVSRYKDMQFKSNKKMEQELGNLMQENKQLSQKIQQIKDRAIQTLVEKQNIINSLNQKIQSLDKVEETLQYLQMKDQYQTLLQKSHEELKESEAKLQQAKLQNIQLVDRIQKDSAAYQQKLMKLEYDLEERMNGNIKEAMTFFQTNQSNLLNDLENLQTTLQKFELKSNQLEIQNQKLKTQIDYDKKKAMVELQNNNKVNNQQISKIYKSFQQIIKKKDKQISELAAHNQKLKKDLIKRTLQEVEERKNLMINIKSNRKLSQSSMYKYGEVNRSFESDSSANKEEKPDQQRKDSDHINQLKDLQQNYEWQGIHKPSIISEFEPNLKQSIESIEAIQESTTYYHKLSSSLQAPIQSSQYFKRYQMQRDQEQISKLKAQVEQNCCTIGDLNRQISALTKQIQDNRQSIADLKKQKHPTKSDRQNQLKAELDSIKLYLCELEKQLLTQKWKYTELVDYLRSEVQVREAEYAKQMSKVNKRKSKV